MSATARLEGRTILLTGGAGFIGSALARRLLPDNRVVVLDTGTRNSLATSGMAGHPNLELRIGDVMDPVAVREAMRGCTIVVHLAAIAGVDTVIKMPVTTMKVNLIGTYNVLEAAVAQGGMERFVDFSTSEVFGSYAYKVSEGDVTSLGAVGEARWTYAVSKLATEHLSHNYRLQYGLPALSVRPFNIYGPGQIGEGAIHRFIVRALGGEDLEIHKDGSQIRAWCYVDDIVDAVMLSLVKPEAVGQAFNVGNARSVLTIYDLARMVIRLSGSASRLTFVDWPFTDVELRIPNIDKARRLLGFEPVVDLEEGLQRTIAWYRDRPGRG
ncbi:MAG TPA: NAD-dependent epimerase/dehydratase family protein, partial [Vicinamibacteria bacterium]|nr:NAD-dependent epimerase/dehydratase family protein [Vicinamibacteria bacterium]